MKCAAYIDPKTGIALEGEALATASKDPDAPRCGYELVEDDMFCPRCGVGVNEIKSRNIRKTSWWSFDGRATRKEYWITFLKVLGVTVCVCVLSAILAVFIKAGDDAKLLLFGRIVGVISSLSLMPVSVRRLHDLGYSAIILVVDVSSHILLSFSGKNEFLWTLLFSISTALDLILFVHLGFVRGTKGPNKYGPDPLA